MDKKTFLNDVGRLLRCDRDRAEAVTAVVFQELGDQLNAKEIEDVAAQLDHGLESLWRDRPDSHESAHHPHREEFIGRVRARATLGDDTEAERAVHVVFHTLQRALGSIDGTRGESWDVFAVLTKDLKPLWLESRAAVEALGSG